MEALLSKRAGRHRSALPLQIPGQATQADDEACHGKHIGFAIPGNFRHCPLRVNPRVPHLLSKSRVPRSGALINAWTHLILLCRPNQKKRLPLAAPASPPSSAACWRFTTQAFASNAPLAIILWMDEILHHPRNAGIVIPP